MKESYNKKEGFSLIEMIIAIAIVAIVMSGVILLMSYSTNSMRRTTNAVNLQNQTKDAMLHMTTYLQEGSEVFWDTETDSDKPALYVAKEKKNMEDAVTEVSVSRYIFIPEETVEEDGSTYNSGTLYFNKLEDDKSEHKDQFSKALEATGDSYSTIFDSDGKLLFKEKIVPLFDSSSINESTVFVNDVKRFLCTVVKNEVSESGTTENYGGTYVKIEMDRENKNKDADFSCVKEVYLRNS